MAAEEAFADQHAQLLADRSIQFDLPAYAPTPPPAWLNPFAHTLDAIAPAMIYIFWGVIGLGAAIILFVVVMEAKGIAWRQPWKSRSADADVSWQPSAEEAQALLAQADALAARGEYEEAVHLLLRHSVSDIAGRKPDFLRPSLTARDIAAAPSVPALARAAFGEIARITETALFARRSIGQDGWLSARDAYGRFAFRDAWA